MTNSSLPRPAASEFEPYYQKYVALVPDGDLVSVLATQIDATLTLLAGLDETQANHRYAPDKWTVKQVIEHMIDVERVMAYRAFRFSRADATDLPGFEENDYARAGRAAHLRLADLATAFAHMRTTTIDLFAAMDETMGARGGTANGASVTARALGYIIAGHERHHVGILKERYL